MMVLFATAIVTASVCEIVFSYYELVIVCLDCSSDIRQIKTKGNTRLWAHAAGKQRGEVFVCVCACVCASLKNVCWSAHTLEMLKVTAGLEWVLNNTGSVHTGSRCSPRMLCFIIHHASVFLSIC